MDVITAVRQSRMNLSRWFAVLICMLCNLVDGLDLLLASYALPHLPADFVTSSQKGTLISLGFAGMAAGSVLIAPMADRVGRRRIVIAMLFMSTLALAASAFVPNIGWMLLTRFITGLAVGTVAPLLLVMADEFASDDRRSLAVGLVALGYPIGSTLGGVIGLVIIGSFNGAWQALFMGGALVSAVVWVIAFFLLPESLAFLVALGTPAARQQIARIAWRLGLADVDPAAEAARTKPAATSNDDSEKVSLLSSIYRNRTWLLWIGYSCGSTAYYFVSAWTPQLVTTASGSTETGTLAGTLVSLGAFAGAALFTVIMLRLTPTKLGWIAGIVAFATQIVFALTVPNGVALIAAVVLGMSMQTVQSAYVASCARLYPTAIRARGQGFMMGISRVGTIVTPLLVGLVLTVISAQTMYLTASVVVAIGTALSFILWATTKAQFSDRRDRAGQDSSADQARLHLTVE